MLFNGRSRFPLLKLTLYSCMVSLRTLALNQFKRMNVNLSTTKQRASYEILKRYRTNLYSNDYKLSEFCNKRLIFSQIMHFGSPVVTRNNGRIQESQNRFLKKFITRETASTTRNQNPSLFSLFILTRLKRG